MAADTNSGKASRSPAPVYLIPWDPDSEEHVERMKVQRVACGWKVNEVDDWRDPQRKGIIGLQWVVLHPDHPETPSRLEQHFAGHPEEVTALLDTCTTILGRPRRTDPLVPFFFPVGHIALDSVTSEPELETSLSNGVWSLMNFYISNALQNRGLGGAALDQCERMAKEEIGARAITLSSIANEYCQADSPRRIALGRQIPQVTNQDWYMRHGYAIYGRKNVAWVDVDANGNEWPVGAVFLRKDLV